MTDRSLVDSYVGLCDELSLADHQRRRLWFAIAGQIARVEDELRNVPQATTDEIERLSQRLGVPSLRLLALRVRAAPAAGVQAQRRTVEDWPVDPKEVLVRHWDDIEEIVSRAARRLKADEEEADTVESRVKELLFADDCEIVRAFRHESSFGSYLKTIVQRTFQNLRVERSGKWHYSAAAERLGPLAKQLERLIHVDGLTSSDAISTLLASHPETTRAVLEAMLESFPARRPRPLKVAVDPTTERTAGDEPNVLVFSGERFRLSNAAAAVVNRFIEQLADGDRLLLLLLFEDDMKMPEVARVLQQPQKRLYRQRDQLFRQLRQELEKAGISRAAAADLYESIAKQSIFHFAKRST
jgi:DNA-directed RNA polymerase specialized sigma24 family protein